MIIKQADDINQLKQKLTCLESAVSRLEKIVGNATSVEASTGTVATLLYSAAVDNSQSQSSTTRRLVQQPVATSPAATKNPDSKIHDRSDRRFNVIVSGVLESAPGTPRSQRWKSDLKNISDLLSSNSSISVPSSSIRDCRRLGKYSTSNPRPRLIMVNFNSITVVMDILSNKSSFAPYVVKPDLSPELRIREKVLLEERWNLIKSGIERSNIKN